MKGLFNTANCEDKFSLICTSKMRLIRKYESLCLKYLFAKVMKKLSISFQGAKEAAKQHCYINTEIKTTGFTYMDESIPPEVKEEITNLSEEVKNKMLLVTDEQVHDQLHKLLMEREIEPIQVVFRDSQCLDCGAQGDLRILDNFCHMEMMFLHPKSAAYFHPETKVNTKIRICLSFDFPVTDSK